MQCEKRFLAISVLRIILAIGILYYHLMQVLTNAWPQNQIFMSLRSETSTVGSNFVIFFFIIAGFLFQSTKVYLKNDFKTFLFKKIINFLPLLFFSIILNWNSGYADLLNIFFIQTGTGLIKSGSSNPASWFVCVLFWLEIIFFLLLSDSTKNNKNLKYGMCAIIAYVGLSLLGIVQENGLYCAVLTKQIPFLTNGVVYAMTGFSLGICISGLNRLILIKNKKINFIIFILIIYLSYATIFRIEKFESIYYIFIFSCIICFDYLRSFNNIFFKVLDEVSQFTYAIYILQFPCFYYLSKYLFPKYVTIEEHWSVFFILVNLLICVAISILAHYTIEKPIKKYLLNKFFNTNA